MKKFFLLLILNNALCILNCTSCFAQNPLVKMWDYRYGGLAWENLYSLQQTTDGGYILGGQSGSGISGDKTQPNWGACDYWIVKIDSMGIKQWDKDFGGSYYDYYYCASETFDHGYMLGGGSGSGVSGDKTQPCWGAFDYWIVKTDSFGNYQWDKRYGGTDYDYLYSLQPTKDGGYILGGGSSSELNGDKTQATWAGSPDYWVVKIDSIGNKQWDKRFGGTGRDLLFSLQQTQDGGYILGGQSNSGLGGDRSQASWGNFDYWVVKIDSIGTLQWDRSYGGDGEDDLYSLAQTPDGGYILGGQSLSGIGGNKTANNWDTTNSTFDYWIIKVDSIGTIQWDNDFGGTLNDEFTGSLSLTVDGGYLLAGNSYSFISGDKTQNNLNAKAGWIVKTDSLGNKVWDRTLLSNTNGQDEKCLAIHVGENCYAIANMNQGSVVGDKTQPAWNNTSDYWILKFCETLLANFTSPSSICPGSCIDFTNLSLQASSNYWSFSGAIPDTSTSINPTNICYASPGNYDVQLIATNANGSDTLHLTNYITVYPTPQPQGITQSGDTLFAIAGGGTYQWYFNNNIINGATDFFYVAPASGDYNVVATDTNGCEVEAAIFNVTAGLTPPDSYRDLSKGEGVIVFPNPVGDQLRIHNSVPIDIGITMGMAPQGVLRTVEISVYNMLGEDIHCEVDRRQLTVDCRLLPSGMYWLEMYDGKRIFRSKFVKQ